MKALKTYHASIWTGGRRASRQRVIMVNETMAVRLEVLVHSGDTLRTNPTSLSRRVWRQATKADRRAVIKAARRAREVAR